MPKFAAFEIPDPFRAMEETNRLRDVALDRQTRIEDMATTRRDREEDAQIRQILGTLDKSEDFPRVFSAINRINPLKAIELQKLYAGEKKTPPRTHVIETTDEQGRRVRKIVPDEPGASYPVPEEPPKARSIEDKYFDPATTAEERAEMDARRRAFTVTGRAPEGEGAGFSLSPGQIRFGPGGREIARAPAAPVEPSVGSKAQAERWRFDALNALEQRRIGYYDERRNLEIPPLSEEQYQRELAKIQASYFQQLGVAPGPTGGTVGSVARGDLPPAPPAPAMPPSVSRPTAAPMVSTPSAPARAAGPGPVASPPAAGPGRVPSKYTVGKKVRLRTPQGVIEVVIKKINPDGTFEY